MNAPTNDDAVASESTQIRWDPCSRVAFVRYMPGTNLVGADSSILVDALTRWIGEREPFGVLADGTGLRGTNAEYRSNVSRFFRQHRDRAFIALINLGPVIHIVVEMFGLGTGIPLKAFADEHAARSWLRTKGIAA